MNLAVVEEKLDCKPYSEEEIAQVDFARMPEHVAIIMDGNRRWAKNKGLPAMVGHWRGAEILSRIVTAASTLGVKVLTLYAFSTENWKRTPLEIKTLMKLIKMYAIRLRSSMIKEGVKFSVIGDISKLDLDIQQVLKESTEATKEGKELDLVIALNYGGRDELKRAIGKIVEDCMANKVLKEELSEEVIAKYLDTARWKDPELVIRTSGESRISNFLLWQISYAEIVVTDVLWPDFSEKNFLQAIIEYQKRELRLGK